MLIVTSELSSYAKVLFYLDTGHSSALTAMPDALLPFPSVTLNLHSQPMASGDTTVRLLSFVNQGYQPCLPRAMRAAVVRTRLHVTRRQRSYRRAAAEPEVPDTVESGGASTWWCRFLPVPADGCGGCARPTSCDPPPAELLPSLKIPDAVASSQVAPPPGMLLSAGPCRRVRRGRCTHSTSCGPSPVELLPSLEHLMRWRRVDWRPHPVMSLSAGPDVRARRRVTRRQWSYCRAWST